MHKQEYSHTKELMAMQHFQDPALQPRDKLRQVGQRPLVLHNNNNNNKQHHRVVYQPIHKVPHWRQIRGSLSQVTDRHHPALTSLDRSSIRDFCQAQIATWHPRLVLPRICGGRCTNQLTKHQHIIALHTGPRHQPSSPRHL